MRDPMESDDSSDKVRRFAIGLRSDNGLVAKEAI